MKKPNLKNMNIKMPKLQLPEKGKAKAGKKTAVKKQENTSKSKIAVSSGQKNKKEVNSSLQEAEKNVREKKAGTQAASVRKSSVKKSSGTSAAGKKVRSGSQKAQRLDQEKMRQRKSRQVARKREAMRNKKILAGIAGALLLLIIISLVACPGKKKSAKEDSNPVAAESTVEETVAGPVSTAEVKHFSFPVLISDEMAGDNNVLTVSQFRQILQELYDANYILVDFYSIAGVQENEDGSSSFTNTELDLPAGKIPFVLSQRDLSYSLDRVGKGYASRLLIGDGDQLTNEYTRSDGAILQGSYDVVPILEEFLAEHPDFSYNNARGVIGLTGYNGILGYRTSELLGLSYEEGNPYAVYGTFDVNAEIEACRPVIELMKQKGWHFASYGNNYCSYGAEYAMVTSDVDTWMANVSDLIGGTDILIFPCETDIGSWSEYNPGNPKYQYLQEHGFKYYCIEEKDNPSWLQIRDNYVRQGIKEIDCYDDFAGFMTVN